MRLPDSQTRWLFILLGSLIAALSMRLFLIPNGLLAGGASGLALIIHYLSGVDVSLMIVLINIPAFLLGWKYLHPGYIKRTALGVASFSLFLFLFRDIPGQMLQEELILPALFGGVLNGLGFGLIFRSRGSIGGTDIISLILNRFYSFGVGTMNLGFNVLLMLAGFFIYDFRLVGYTLLSMYVMGYVIDRVQLGFNRGMWVMIICDQPEAVREAIISRLGRGVTVFSGEGGYTHLQKRILVVTVSKTQLAKLKDIVAQIDDKAFVTVSETTEVLGRGFSRHLEKERSIK